MSADAANLDLVPGRECGDCRACCQVFPINEPELQKPGGTMCGHACAAGCGIYQSRPNGCRSFHCLWRQSGALSEEARPDKLGVIFWVSGQAQPQNLFEIVHVTGAPVDDVHALDQPMVQGIVEHLAAHGSLPIFLHWGGAAHMIHPGPEMADAIVREEATDHPTWLTPARAWVQRYLPIARQYRQVHG